MTGPLPSHNATEATVKIIERFSPAKLIKRLLPKKSEVMLLVEDLCKRTDWKSNECRAWCAGVNFWIANGSPYLRSNGSAIEFRWWEKRRAYWMIIEAVARSVPERVKDR